MLYYLFFRILLLSFANFPADKSEVIAVAVAVSAEVVAVAGVRPVVAGTVLAVAGAVLVTRITDVAR